MNRFNGSFLLALFVTGSVATALVAVNTSGAGPHSSAMFDISSTDAKVNAFLQMLHPADEVGVFPALPPVETQGGMVVFIGLKLKAGKASLYGPLFDSTKQG